MTFDAGLTDPGNDFFLLKSLSDPKIFEQCVTSTLSAPPYDRLVESIIPITPDAKGGHHFTNGDTWVECLAISLKMPGDSRPALKPGRHVAQLCGRRRTDRSAYPCRFNLPDQKDAFIKDGFEMTSQTLFILEVGGNDVRDAIPRGLIGLELL
ncbi:hypothetical protein [Methylomicrobium sp. Wu6]|uniref:hypothetical protein n=1 Tax=Methylomicrobium sp. Wu6 TaxID=3107928 RepID=UPI002DD6AA93|nr:hypothetical protein [Methylomicrobium sp. Wu6]